MRAIVEGQVTIMSPPRGASLNTRPSSLTNRQSSCPDFNAFSPNAALPVRRRSAFFSPTAFPDPQSTLPILQALDKGGVDFIELGMPFSDPLAEGLPIQRSSARALGHGVTMADAFRTAEQFRATSETPLLLMGYINPISVTA